MDKPRIFLGSSGQQAELLEAITLGLEDVADVEPWTTTFNPGRSTLDRLVELSGEVDFAAFVFAQDDWTTTDATQSGEASPRDNVVFEAGLFGGALGIRRTFILHANGSKLPTDLLGLTTVRYDPATGPAEVQAINEKLRKAIEAEGRRGSIEGLWWQLSLTMRTESEPSAVSLLQGLAGPRRRPEPDRPGLAGRRDAVGPLLERGRKGAPESGRDLLLLERRAPSGPGCPATRGHRRDQGRNRRSRHRVLDDPVGSRPRAECPDLRGLPSSRPRRPRGARRRERGGPGCAHRAASRGVEVGLGRILSISASVHDTVSGLARPGL